MNNYETKYFIKEFMIDHWWYVQMRYEIDYTKNQNGYNYFKNIINFLIDLIIVWKSTNKLLCSLWILRLLMRSINWIPLL